MPIGKCQMIREKIRHGKILGKLAVVVVAASFAGCVQGGPERVDGAGTDSAILKVPQGAGPFPAIVYHHGSVVREKGYQGAVQRGYDVAALATAFAEAGYVTLAPIRETAEGCCNGDEAVAEGLAVSRSAARTLRARPDVAKDRICLVGFSEGGMISLWTLAEMDDFAAALIMSPATMGRNRARTERYSVDGLMGGGLAKIREPFLLTVGTDDNRSIRRAVRRYVSRTGRRLRTLDGDHQSFQTPRSDIMAALSQICPK